MAICQGPVANLFFATGPFLAEMEGFEPLLNISKNAGISASTSFHCRFHCHF